MEMYRDNMYIILKQTQYWSGTVIQICNPIYLEDRDQEDWGLRQLGKKVHETPSQSVVEYGSAYLSSQLCRLAQIGGLWSRLTQA
jgi:hypothetical protein